MLIMTKAEMTADEMTRTSHKRAEMGFTAITAAGEVFVWVSGLKVWVCVAPLIRRTFTP